MFPRGFGIIQAMRKDKEPNHETNLVMIWIKNNEELYLDIKSILKENPKRKQSESLKEYLVEAIPLKADSDDFEGLYLDLLTYSMDSIDYEWLADNFVL